MKMHTVVWIGLAALVLVGGPVKADDDADVQKAQQQIDQEQPKPDTDRVKDLANQFKVPEKTVQDLRTQKQGWGEITIGLASAQQLMKSDPKTYPTMDAALQKIEGLRSSGEGWGKIAKDLGFKLGPVVSAAHHSEHAMHADHAMHGMNGQHPDHPMHPSHPTPPSHPTH